MNWNFKHICISNLFSSIGHFYGLLGFPCVNDNTIKKWPKSATCISALILQLEKNYIFNGPSWKIEIVTSDSFTQYEHVNQCIRRLRDRITRDIRVQQTSPANWPQGKWRTAGLDHFIEWQMFSSRHARCSFLLAPQVSTCMPRQFIGYTSGLQLQPFDCLHPFLVALFIPLTQMMGHNTKIRHCLLPLVTVWPL